MESYRFNIRAYLAETAEAGPADDLVYRRLIDLYYLKEGPLPADTAELAEQVEYDEEVVVGVLEAFFTLTKEGWLHKRLQADILSRQPRKWPRKIKLKAP